MGIFRRGSKTDEPLFDRDKMTTSSYEACSVAEDMENEETKNKDSIDSERKVCRT